MSKMGKIAAVLAVSAAGAVVGSSGSPALAGPQQVIGVVLNANISSSAPCEPKETSIEEENLTIKSISKRCSRTTRTTTSSNGGTPKNQEVVLSDPFTVGAGTRATLRQACPKGKAAIGGGYDLHNSIFNKGTGADLVHESRADAAGTAWELVVVNPTENDVEVTVRAVCANLS